MGRNNNKTDSLTLLLLVFLLLPIISNAQVSITGSAEAKAGMGDIAPIESNINLDINSARLSFKPYLGFKLDDNRLSAELEDINYIYSRTGNHYRSSSDRIEKGQTLRFGAEMEYNIDSRNQFSFTVKGSNSNLRSEGTREEDLITPEGELLSRVKSKFIFPNMDGFNNSMETRFLHKTKRNGESLQLKYSYNLSSSEEEMKQEVIEQTDFPHFTENKLETDTRIQTHSVTLDWKRPITAGHTIDVGMQYRHHILKSYNQQWLDGLQNLDETFLHTTQTATGFFDYAFSTKSFSLNTHLEYDFTHMQNRNLHDFVPKVQAIWRINPSNALIANYATRIIRPGINVLCPAHIIGTYTLDYGNPNLIGSHIKNASLSYQLKTDRLSFSTSIAHIFTDDGITAIWMEKDNIRESTYGNEGVRRAWSLSPEFQWILSPQTTLHAKATLIWDKRIAYAISMAKEHWGLTTHADVQQRLPYGIALKVYCDYSEGNTLDLYSHCGRMLDGGASVQRSFLKGNNLTASISYEYKNYATVFLTQGAYTGTVFNRPGNRNTISLDVNYKF